jgi:hypothetical protein
MPPQLEESRSARTCSFLDASPLPSSAPSCVYPDMRGALLVLALVLLTACPGGTPDPEQTTVDGRTVFLVQEARCFLGDCVASFFVNRVNYTPSCASLPAWLRNEARAGETYAVADPDVDAAPPFPYERATSLRGISPRWMLGVHTQDLCRQGPRWVIAFDQSVPEFDRAVCAAGRPRLASWLGVECP